VNAQLAKDSDRISVAIAICTYKRNELLAVLLQALIACADRVKDRAAVGVVVIDDTAQGNARVVADAFADKFELGLTYGISGKQNISLARNKAINTAIEMAEWTCMTDDDCEPPVVWLEALLDSQQKTGADCITGRMVRRVPPGSPKWLEEQPFLEMGVVELADGSPMEVAATFNSMIRSQWLKDRPHIRFDPEYGVIGGEDMVFYRAARAEGLTIRFATTPFVYENELPERATFGYQLYIHYWHGNSSYLASVESGASRGRMFLHGGASLVRAVLRPFQRLVTGKSPQWRYGLAMMLHAVGKLVGALGMRVDHR
jgi:succinoglycan biosynthesis protein ExoM